MATTLDRIATLFGKRSSPFLGLDLGASSVRVVGISKDNTGKLSLDVCVSERLPPGAVIGGSITNLDAVADIIERLLEKNGVRTKNVVMALPTAAVVTRKVRIARDLKDAEFDAQVELEVSPYLPWAIDDASIDFHVVSSNALDTETEVLVAAARRDMVEERATLADASGLDLIALDVEPYARTRAAKHLTGTTGLDNPKELVAIIEIGSSTTLFQVSKNDEIIYDRDLPFGGMHLTQLIERVYGLEPAEAERQKRSRELPSGFEGKVIVPYINNVAAEIERELHAFHSKSGPSRIANVLLSGGGACLPGLAKAVASQSGLPSSLANPFVGIGLKKDSLKSRLKTERPGYLTAVGLALRGMVQ